MTKPTVTIGGKTWHLRYDFNALAELEGALKQTLQEIGSRLQRGRTGAREIRALVWSGLLHENEDLGIRQVGDWLTEAAFFKNDKLRDELLASIYAALAEAFPEAVATDGREQDPN